MRSCHRLFRLVSLIVILTGALSLPAMSAGATQSVACSDYSTTAAAQFALDINPSLASALDPDGNGIACDDAIGAGQPGTSGQDRSSSDLQLPGDSSETPTPSGQDTAATADVVDQQPTDTTITTTQSPATGIMDARIGGSRTSWEAVYGAPIEVSEGSSPEIVLTTSPSIPTSQSVVTLWYNDQAYIVLIAAETSWTGADLAPIIQDILPADITSIPDGETLSDGSLLIPMFSEQLASAVDAAEMTEAGAPGVPGDLYLLLVTGGGDQAIEAEVGIGNGDNVREDVNAAGTTTMTDLTPATTIQPTAATTVQPPPVTAATTTTPDPATFLRDTRTEVDGLQAEIDELWAILGAGTFSETETQRVSEIIVSWLGADTSLPDAPAEHSGIATRMQQVRTDIASVGLSLFTALGTGDTSDIEATGSLLTSIEATLNQIDQELTALGF